MARVREASGELQAAEGEYRALLEQFPDYADCYLRLACVAKMRGDTKVCALSRKGIILLTCFNTLA